MHMQALRALYNARVYVPDLETELAKRLEVVRGLPEELLDPALARQMYVLESVLCVSEGVGVCLGGYLCVYGRVFMCVRGCLCACRHGHGTAAIAHSLDV